MNAISPDKCHEVTIRDGETYTVMTRDETRCMWARSLALCEEAGSGQLGFEAMSRGAASVTFVDMEREAMEIVKKNAENTGFFSRSHFLVSDYRNYIRKAAGRERFDLVFIDPPYELSCCTAAAAALRDAELIIPGALVVLESGEEKIDINAPELSGFELIKSEHYGKKTAVNILLYRPSES